MSTPNSLFINSEKGKVKSYELRESYIDIEENVFLNGCPICILNRTITDEDAVCITNINGEDESSLVENLFDRLSHYDVSYCKMLLKEGYASFLEAKRELINALKPMFNSCFGRKDK